MSMCFHHLAKVLSLGCVSITFKSHISCKEIEQQLLNHNQEASAGLHSFTMGLNHLADMVLYVSY